MAELHPITSRPWERSVRFWSQAKHGQDEEAILKIPGALRSVATIHLSDACVMVPMGTSNTKLMECGPNTATMLQALQYGKSKEVVLSGTEFVLGDVSVVFGRVTKRTNDLQQVCIFMSIWHHESCMMSRVDSIITACAILVRDVVRLSGADIKIQDFKRSKAPAYLGDCFTPSHEAYCYFEIACR